MSVINGRPFHVAGAGCVLTRRGGRLVAYRDGTLRASAPLTQVAEVVLTGNVTVTTAAMHAVLAHDIPLILLSGTGRALGRLEPPTAPHLAARQRQLELCRDPAARLDVARAIVAGKIRNQQVLLRRRARRSHDPDHVWAAAARLAQLEESAAVVTSLPSLLGTEGAASGAYFGALRRVIDPEYGFATRNRTGTDVVNALVNYVSALLRETVISALLTAGLDPHVSYLHTPSRGRPTLAFDLMEEWRPVLLEPLVLALLGLGTVTPESLRDTPDGPRLSPEATTAAITRFHARLAVPAREWPTPSGRPTYGETIRRQALRLRSWILGDHPAYEPFRWR